MEKVIVGNNLLGKISELINLEKFSKVAVLTDKNVAGLWLEKLESGINKDVLKIVVEPGEGSKSLRRSEIIWQKMLNGKMDRRSLLINLGGGVITDLGGFVASTFMRGIDFINAPTTLLAMADASIGGKTGINLQGTKNIIGTFSEPEKIIIDTNVLKTLSDRVFVEGFAEIIKHSIIDGRDYFELVTSKKPREFDGKELEKIIKESVRIKSAVVDKDKKEKGLRKVLNFGHTIGHAIESISLKTDRPLLHGEAIAIGMVAESKLAQLMGLLSEKDFLLIKNAVDRVGLPCCHPDEGRDPDLLIHNILQIMSFDKKNIEKRILWSLPKKIGQVTANVQVPDALIVEVLRTIL
ncbi:3-dehydroquinate synthase [Patescibacteria group bacterium]|nr:3-dehydroquinate synthase [Patescibacteria group bacterium]